MLPTEQPKEFYENLGKLFYALAKADKNIVPQEVASLQNSIRNYWVSLNDGDAASKLIQEKFELLHQQEKKAKDCFDEFEAFYLKNPPLFSPEIKNRIWKTADDIAASFAHKNKSEVIILNKLKLLLSS